MTDSKGNKDLDRLFLATGKAFRYLLDPPAKVQVRPVTLKLKVGAGDVLLIYAVDTAEGPMIGFTGAGDGLAAIRKAAAQVRDGKLKFRPDEYRRGDLDNSLEGW